MDPYIEMFNVPYIQQQSQQQHHQNQILEVQKCAKALYDFFDGIDKIEPNYRQMANVEFSAIIYNYFHKHGAM